MIDRFNRNYFDLLMAMTIKEFSVRYKQAIFGFLWVILNPLLQMAIIGIIFSYFMNTQNYFIFLFSGLLPWQFISLSISKITPAFVFERDLLQKAVFPRDVIPLSIVLANGLNFLLSLFIFIPLAILLVHMQVNNLLLLLPATCWIFFFVVGFSLLTSSLNVRFRDVTFFVQTLVLLWFYATPILYSLNNLPTHIHELFYLNPIVAPILMFQQALTNQSFAYQTFIVPNAILSLIIMYVGVITFKKESPVFTDWL